VPAPVLSSILRDGLRVVLDLRRLLGVYVEGIEVTQSLQYYRSAQHLTDPNDVRPDNSVQLVGGKPAWVRVYVRPFLPRPLTGVSGRLRVERRVAGIFWSTVATLTPQGAGTITADPTVDYATERENLSRTLNFVVPADAFSGMTRLIVELTPGSAEHPQVVDASLWQTLRLRAILVSYAGPSTAAMPPPGSPPPPSITLPAPSLADLQATSALALNAMPVEATGLFTAAGTPLPWTRPLDDPRTAPGQCSANWDALLIALAGRRTSDGNRADVVYYGLLPTGIPLNVPGCGRDGLGAGQAYDGGTLLHEIGHGYGFAHTPCGAAGATDPNYPTYEPYPSASIGEYGLNVSNGTVWTPRGTKDYMSYCFPQWMSLYQHGRLIQHPRLNPRWVRDKPYWKDGVQKAVELPPFPPPPDPQHWRWQELNPERLISLIGRVEDGRVSVQSVARVEAMSQIDGPATELTAQLVGGDGATLARAPLVRLNQWGGGGCGGCDCGESPPTSYAFQAFLPDVEDGVALRIGTTDDDERWVRRAPDTRPEVGDVRAEVDQDGGLAVRWSARAGESPEYWLQWSPDEGRVWLGLATGLTEEGVRLEPGGVPTGDISVRVLAHDGFWTAVSEPVRVTVPERAAEVAILHPRGEEYLEAGAPLRLWGAASAPGRGGPVEVDAVWELDGQRVAEGLDAWVTVPGPGEHRVRLVVRSSGGEAEDAVTFTARPEPEAPRDTAG
jgi:hypothetical protein